jgi:undecaprenyl-diphosphatase
MEWASLLFGDWHAVLLVIVAGMLVWWQLGRLEGILIPVAGLISLINYVFKIVINRPRPSPDVVRVLISEQGKTFPSGHTFFATIFLGILAYLFFTHLKRRSLRVLSLVIFVMLILLVGISRVYLGAHWPSDVIGGYIVGGLFLALLIWGYEWWKTRLKARNTKP